MKHIASNSIYSPQNFLELCTSECYIIADNATAQIDFLLKEKKVMNRSNKPVRSFAFDDIESAIKDNASVILVDVTGVNDGGEFVYAFRWYEAPKGLDSSYAG